MPTKRSNTTTEVRLLRTITQLTETLAITNAVAVAQYDPSLIGRTGTLVRLTLEGLRDRVLDGRLDLMHATADDIEDCVSQAVVLAAGKLLGTVPGDVADPQAPSQENPGAS